MVFVGGLIIVGFDDNFIRYISKCYFGKCDLKFYVGSYFV